MPSFDIMCEANAVELKNAVETANKEIANRFDFKGSDARIELKEKEHEITAFADDDFKLGQEHANGRVRVKLYKGTVLTTGRKSKDSLFDQAIATMEEDRGAYNQADAGGFIKLNALRMRIAAKRGRK